MLIYQQIINPYLYTEAKGFLPYIHYKQRSYLTLLTNIRETSDYSRLYGQSCSVLLTMYN